MSDYRRNYIPGGTYFFTIATHERQPLLIQTSLRTALREAIMQIRAKLPFESIAWVLLPDHLHTIWRLPETDSNFGLRWARIKQLVTRTCLDHSQSTNVSESRTTRREGSIWQRRFWEHTIRDESDLRHHIDYIHYNPVKHGYAAKPADWPYSTFHRFVRNGVYPKDWASTDEGGITNFGE